MVSGESGTLTNLNDVQGRVVSSFPCGRREVYQERMELSQKIWNPLHRRDEERRRRDPLNLEA